jgi:hypothetical protein
MIPTARAVAQAVACGGVVAVHVLHVLLATRVMDHLKRLHARNRDRPRPVSAAHPTHVFLKTGEGRRGACTRLGALGAATQQRAEPPLQLHEHLVRLLFPLTRLTGRFSGAPSRGVAPLRPWVREPCHPAGAIGCHLGTPRSGDHGPGHLWLSQLNQVLALPGAQEIVHHVDERRLTQDLHLRWDFAPPAPSLAILGSRCGAPARERGLAAEHARGLPYNQRVCHRSRSCVLAVDEWTLCRPVRAQLAQLGSRPAHSLHASCCLGCCCCRRRCPTTAPPGCTVARHHWMLLLLLLQQISLGALRCRTRCWGTASPRARRQRRPAPTVALAEGPGHGFPATGFLLGKNPGVPLPTESGTRCHPHAPLEDGGLEDGAARGWGSCHPHQHPQGWGALGWGSSCGWLELL